MIAIQLTALHRSMLRAVAEGRGRPVSGCHPTLSVDGRWCDFTATTELVSRNLVRPAWPAPVGTSAPALLTPAGVETLAALAPDPATAGPW